MRSFLSLPLDLCDPSTARYRIIPVPYEGTVCFLGGTAKGPDAILDVSDQMEHFDEELLIDFTQQGIATLPPIPSADTPEKMFDSIYQTVKQESYFQAGKFPIFLGGEHSITPPIVRAAAECYGKINVLQFDAHADLRDSYTGGKFSHASAMRRVLEVTSQLVQVGIRSFSHEEYRDCPQQISRIITPRMIRQDEEHCVAKILDSLAEPVYITVDIDVFDPAFAPATGTPEPGGLDWFQVTNILRRVCETKNVVGADIVETAPFGNGNVITEFLAVRLAGKIIAYTV
ncbi:MAG: agmatinase [Planctomycetaceae bacterium]|jgi:agmatinase|nr:agmatinase [Planctomycetaceae bacterium]